MACELIYVILVILMGFVIFGNIPLSAIYFTPKTILYILLIIIEYCSIFNFVSMICSEITASMIINILSFFIIFSIGAYLGGIANSSKYINGTYTDENNITTIVNQEINPNYPGDEKVKMAKIICLFIPEEQAGSLMDEASRVKLNQIEDLEIKNEFLRYTPICAIVLIGFVNITGAYVFGKKDLK